jgi:outer membrane protein TolC
MNKSNGLFNKLLFTLFGIYAFFLESSSVSAAPTSAPSPQPLTFENLLKSTLSNNGMIQESAQDIEVARAQLDRAKAAFWPKASVGFLGAPIFEETGDALNSKTNLNKWGPFLRGSI